MKNKSLFFMTKVCLFACAFFAVVSCKDDDEFFSKSDDKPASELNEANTFDFSTTQEVDLIVDYSAFNANVPVFFSVYSVNPFVNENKSDEYIDENVNPIFAGYTDKQGRFDQTVTLPAYAKVLHIVTGNFLVGLRRTMVEVMNGQAKAIVDKPTISAFSRLTRATGPGVSTNDITTLKNLYEYGGSQVYKPWYTPLGTWNSASGRPDYLLDKATAAPGLVFSEEEFNGLYATACSALNSGTSVKEEYRANSDMTLIKDSEVSITMLGSSTCWNSSLGYFYYTGDAPTNKKDLNIIMIFPNTQDGEWPRGSYPNNDYKGNIGTLRGDVVQLMYYPNIASGDFSGATTTFPAGTKIGFILKSNGWGCLGKNYAVNGSYSNNKPVWASSTDGLSLSNETGTKFSNPKGESRTAKFSFESAAGNKYAIISFEDANDDKDYDDLVFALNPANAFLEVSGIENRAVSTYGVYGFEDMWPEAHDYDMNDGMIEVEHVKEFYVHASSSDNTLVKETFNFRTDHNYITQENSFGVRLNTKAQLATIYANKAATNTAPDPSEATTKSTISSSLKSAVYSHPNFTTLLSSKSDNNGIYYFYFNDIYNGDKQKTTYSIEVTYQSAQTKSQASVQAFLCHKEGSSYHEVHVPFEAPTPKAVTSYFGTKDDYTDNSTKNYYTSKGDFPFAFYLEDAKLKDFETTLLDLSRESIRIDTVFTKFITWSKSKGKTEKDWYKNPTPKE